MSLFPRHPSGAHPCPEHGAAPQPARSRRPWLTFTAAAAASLFGLTASLATGSAGKAPAPSQAAQLRAAKAKIDTYIHRESNGRAEVRGIVQVTRADTKRGPQYSYALEAGDRTLAMDLDDAKIKGSPKPKAEQPLLEAGQVIVANGALSGGTITVSGTQATTQSVPSGLTPITSDSATHRGTTTRRVLVIPVLYSTDPQTGRFPLANLTPNLAQITDFYKKSSGGYDSALTGPSIAGDVTFDFTVRPWQSIGVPRPTPPASNQCANLPALQTTAIDTAFGIDRATANYDHYIYLVPCERNGASGDGSMPGETVRIFYDNIGWDNVAHELGHNLGLHHSNREECRVDGINVPLPTTPASGTENCTSDSYGGSSDVMGGSGTYLSGFHRARLGFLPLSHVKEIAPAEGTVQRVWHSTTRLAPLNGQPRTQVLRLPRPTAAAAGNTRTQYYLGIRGSTTTFEEHTSNHPLRRGLEIQAASGDYGSTLEPNVVDAHAVASRMYFLNSSTGQETSSVRHPDGLNRHLRDFSLTPGRSLYDPVENYTITTVAVGATGGAEYADVTVEAGPPRQAATSVGVFGRKLVVRASPGVSNNVLIGTAGSTLSVADYGTIAAPGTGCTAELGDPQVAKCPLTGFDSVEVILGDGDDQATADRATTKPITLKGDAGNDTLVGGSGDDIVTGGAGQDYVSPGPAGFDTVSFADRSTPVTFDADVNVLMARSTEGDDEIAYVYDYIGAKTYEFDRFVGTSGADVIRWTRSPNGNQVSTGDKTVDGGPGVDTISIAGSNNTILSRDGLADGALDCGSGTGNTALAESLDTQITGCGTPIVATAPTIVTGPAEGAVVKASPAPTFTFKMYVSPEAFSCKVDSGAWASCPASFSIPNLTNGPHTLRVRQNPGTVETIRNFTVDTVAPAAPTILTAPSGRVNGRYAKVTFSAPGSHTTKCFLNYQGKECASPRSYADLAEGDYVFTARSVDEAGNTSASSTMASWTVDRTAPPAPLVGGPTGTITDPRPIFTFSSSVADLASHECRLVPVGGTAPAFRACTGSGTDQPTANLADGEYRFEARAKDTAGNTGVPTTRTVWVVASGGTVRVNASELEIIAFADRVNTLKVSQSGATYVIDDTVSLQAQAGCSQVTIKQVTCPTTGVGSLWLEAGDRDDDIDVQIPITAYLNGDAGNDTLRGVGTGTDYFYGGTGSDTVTYAGTTTAVTVSLAAATAVNGGPVGGPQDFFATDVENLTGGSGNDTLTGRAAAVSTLRGGAGADILRAGAGGSILDGGDGNDSLTGAAGADTADYRSRTDALTINLTTGQASGIATAGGTDTIASTIDTLLSGSGSDTLTDGPGDKRIEAGGGADTIIDAAGNDTYLGGDSSDTFRTVTGGGNDTFDGGANVDTLDLSTFTSGVTISRDGLRNDGIPGATADLDNVLPGIESFKTGSGNDTINAGTGMTLGTFTLGAGTDTVSYATSAQSLEVSAFSDKLSAWVGSDTNTLVEAERIIGTNGNDFVAAGTGGTADRPVTIEGGAGDDEIVGGSKADVLIGGTGLDVLRGGDGNDRLETRDTIGGETADCGLGTDSALTDTTDTRTSCETVL